MKRGLYEKIVTNEIEENLQQITDEVETAFVQEAEADVVLTAHLTEVTQLALRQIEEDRNIKKEDKVARQVRLVNQMINLIEEDRGEEFQRENVVDKAKMLYAINGPAKENRPVTPLSQTMLFTNAKNEPNLYDELRLEMLSSDRVDLLVSFIKWSGIRCLKEALETYTKDRKLRVITTSYMGASDYHAIEFLSKLPNTEVKISYDTKRTKHHAKAYMFHRDTGFSTAYIGSSNLSHSALVNGLEWNVKVTERDSKDVMDKFEAIFDSYWHDDEFITFTEQQGEKLKKALEGERYKGESGIEIQSTITPNYFQKEILEKLKVERTVYGRTKNLVVAATGVGKTVISALDYKRFRREHRGEACRLLFVAHKQEILTQSINTFRRVLMDWNFGELYYNGRNAKELSHLFVTVQTFNSKKFYENLEPDYYDFIVIDEFHHAAAASYQALLEYFQPKLLLGLTATPERMDGKNVLEYFDDRIAAEMRLGEAIDYGLLSPFHYFCITDSVDYSNLEWGRGGYNKEDLGKLVSGDTQRAELVISSMQTYLTDINRVTGLGFCASIAHGEFMEEYFNRKGISSVFLQGNHSEEERQRAIAELNNGKISFIFTVDLFNEGVDIPDVNTVLFLRPTESLTVFIQQLGRGLRLSPEKECLTVLDYVGHAHKSYNYYEKFQALSHARGKELKDGIEKGSFLLPKGCHIYMEKVAKEYILRNIDGYINNKKGIIEKIKDYHYSQGKIGSVAEFVEVYGLSLSEIYKIKIKLHGKIINGSYYRLCIEAGVLKASDCPDELKLANALGRLSFMRSVHFLRFIIEVLKNIETYKDYNFEGREAAYMLMFHYTVWGEALNTVEMHSLNDSLLRLYENRPIYEEILSILTYNYERIDSVTTLDHTFANNPLECHGEYTTDQILVALGKHTADKKYHFQEGVLHVKEKNLDALFITLNKVEKHYSPSTMYKDYAINETLFHWQTQSKISPDSPTCQRYIQHKDKKHHILLFVREHKQENGLTSPFVYLGTADYVRHNGQKPVNIIWKLKEALPARLISHAEKAL